MVAINIVVTANNLITVDTAVAMVKAVYTTISVLVAAAMANTVATSNKYYIIFDYLILAEH